MNLAWRIKSWLNWGLQPWNLRLESLTAEKAEKFRLSTLDSIGHFSGPVLPVLDSFRRCDPSKMFDSVRRYEAEMAKFAIASSGNGYRLENDYFTSPDAEVAYAFVRELRPRRIIEVGSGHSTWLFRSAIDDAKLDTELVSIDPAPRQEVAAAADRVLPHRLETLDEAELVASLDAQDILFIDSSHKVASGNDVIALLLRFVPALRPGVVVHIHDIFLPFEYPKEWLIDFGWPWNEQFLVQALLQDSDALEVLWPGHYLQRTRPDFAMHFAARPVGRASSLWLRKRLS